MADRESRGGRQPLDRRESLLARLEYLLVEVEALAPILEEIPHGVLTARPTGEPSVLEAFRQLAVRDRQAAAIAGGREPREQVPGPDDRTADVLAALRDERTALLQVLEQQEEAAWERQLEPADDDPITLYDLADHIVQQDLAVLRSLADRLRTANLFGRLGE